MQTTLTRSFATLLLCSMALAGPLNPPAGAVAPTAKPLTEVEPRIAVNATNTPGDAGSLFKITQPGSYYVTGNITGVSGKHGIAITSSGVTLDLNGFDLVGVAGSLDGVSTTVANLVNIAVTNGSVRNWGDKGVDLVAMSATNCGVTNVRARGNTGSGIGVGSVSVVKGCLSSSNLGDGLTAGSKCVVSDSVFDTNGGHGVSFGFYGTITACHAASNTGNGFSLAGGAAVTACSASSNLGIGILAGFASTVTHSTSLVNSSDGIRVDFGSSVIGNTCRQNGNGSSDGAGIRVTGFHNRIEGNNCSTADRGIDVDSGGNFIARNTCAGNTVNWDVVAGNTILVVQGSSAGAVLGNTGGNAPGSTDPNANFSY